MSINFDIEVVGQNWSREEISLFLEDWRSGGRVALSCRLSMDLLCHEMRDACGENSESLDSPRSLCSECQRSSLVELPQQQSLSLTMEGTVTTEERDVVREIKEKLRDR